ncbi:MAG: hypothetical protein U0807_17330 [Candidatus Binatia bacterium]
MTRIEWMLGIMVAMLAGCATVGHGLYQDVHIDSNPPGATATVSGTASERGPLFLDSEKHVVTTPATVRLRRDNSYRVEIEKPGYAITQKQIVSSYDWLWAQVACGPCEFVGDLPRNDMSQQPLALQFLEAVFYDYPRGFFRAIGRGTRLFSPEALLGTSFKLRPKDAGFWSDWHALGTPEIVATLEPTGR